MNQGPYPDAKAVEMAIKAAAEKAHRVDPSVRVNERIRQAHFDRLLCRVFSGGDASEWILKGGTGVLARVPNARATKDIDLYRYGYPLNTAVKELQRLARIDLGDHFRFEYLAHKESIGGDQQPYTAGYRVTFETYLGVKRLQQIRVDLVAGLGEIEAIDVAEPANRIDLPRLVTHPYRLYPVVNQIADKVCATLATYSTGTSSRERDLVDLVVLALTQIVDAQGLRRAIVSEAHRRGLGNVRTLAIPSSWGKSYAKMAATTPSCATHPRVEDAEELMAIFIDAILGDEGTLTTWDPASQSWQN